MRTIIILFKYFILLIPAMLAAGGIESQALLMDG
jgi:hypothetical protein